VLPFTLHRDGALAHLGSERCAAEPVRPVASVDDLTERLAACTDLSRRQEVNGFGSGAVQPAALHHYSRSWG
jgi:hypothetical protein